MQFDFARKTPFLHISKAVQAFFGKVLITVEFQILFQWSDNLFFHFISESILLQRVKSVVKTACTSFNNYFEIWSVANSVHKPFCCYQVCIFWGLGLLLETDR